MSNFNFWDVPVEIGTIDGKPVFLESPFFEDSIFHTGKSLRSFSSEYKKIKGSFLSKSDLCSLSKLIERYITLSDAHKAFMPSKMSGSNNAMFYYYEIEKAIRCSQIPSVMKEISRILF